MIDEIWNLMVDGFPENQHSSYEVQKSLFERNHYNCKTIKDESKTLGFICYWQFEKFVFIEHLSVLKEKRGNGLGGRLIKDILDLNKKVILEIEDTNIENNTKEIKRLKFYENLGFKLNHKEYYQQPLNKNDLPVKLELLTYPELFDDDELEEAINIIKDNVYKNRF